MKVSELLVSSLESYGVKRAYGLVGTSILELMDALSRSKIRYISTRHEQVAVSMADAEGRVTGKPGVAFVHGGPGFLNSLVSLANAWKDGSPMILVAGAVRRRMVGMDSWLEVGQKEMTKGMVKGAWRIEGGSGVNRAFSDAYSLAASPPKGPVYVEVPEDMWAQDAGRDVARMSKPDVNGPDARDVQRVHDAVVASKRPLLVVGGGLNSPEGAEAMNVLLSKMAIPVVSTSNGRGVVPEDHPLSFGRIGFGGLRIADAMLAQADLVLCLGCGLSDVSTYGYNATPRGEVFAVNMDPLSGRKPVPLSLHSGADAALFAKELADLAKGVFTPDEWKPRIEREKQAWKVVVGGAESQRKKGYVNPAHFLGALDMALPRDAIIATGQGLHQVYAYMLLRVRSERSFLAATNMGAMGFVFPAALGAKMAYPERFVVGVMGDGEFMMTVQDLETAVRERIGARLVVVNDNSYRVLLMRQKIQKMGRVFGTLHGNPDLAQVARDFGGDGLAIDSDDDVEVAVKFLLAPSDLPRLVELRVDPEDLPPINIQGSLMF